MLNYDDLRRELDYFLEEHSISELLEMVYYAVQCREEEILMNSKTEDKIHKGE